MYRTKVIWEKKIAIRHEFPTYVWIAPIFKEMDHSKRELFPPSISELSPPPIPEVWIHQCMYISLSAFIIFMQTM